MAKGPNKRSSLAAYKLLLLARANSMSTPFKVTGYWNYKFRSLTSFEEEDFLRHPTQVGVVQDEDKVTTEAEK